MTTLAIRKLIGEIEVHEENAKHLHKAATANPRDRWMLEI